jgi:hypothetical protein
LNIYISSLGRADKNKSITFFPEWMKELTKIVVVPEEYEQYRGIFPAERLLVLPEEVKGLSANRQWLLENAEGRYVVFMDDDLLFFRRKEDSIKLRNATPEDMSELYYLWQAYLQDGIPMIGLSLRFGNNRVEEDYEDCCRIMDVFAIDREVFLKEGIRFDRVKLMQDLDVSLQVLEAGYKNRLLYKFAESQWKGTGAIGGGCNVYRTSELLRETAYKLVELHPKTVKVAAKISECSWNNMETKPGIEGTVRTDVNVQWKKAYLPKEMKKVVAGGITDFFRKG